MDDGRYLLLLDLLGFKALLKEHSAEVVSGRIETILLDECERWTSERPERDFDTIHFSDTVLIFPKRQGSYPEWYDDLIFIGSRICTRLLAEKIPVRGTLSYGSFVVRDAGRHKVFVGGALVDAHLHEAGLKSIGFVVTPSAWRRMYRHDPTEYLQSQCKAAPVKNDCLWINFLTHFSSGTRDELLGELHHYWESGRTEDLPWIDEELLAFAFVSGEARARSDAASSGDDVAKKYVNADAHLRDLLGDDLYGYTESLVPRLQKRRGA